MKKNQLTLREALDRYSRISQSLTKHLNNADIHDWDDITFHAIADFKRCVLESVAPNTARIYFISLCVFLDMFVDEYGFYKDYRKVLRSKPSAVVKTFLDTDELKKLEAVTIKSRNEAVVLHQFLIGAYTGMRWSDVQNVTDENVTDGMLTYVSVKTSTEATVPVSQRILDYIHDTQGESVSRMTFNRVISALCKRAGISRTVKVYKAGKERTGPKWAFVTSHTARVSFCTNLSSFGVELPAISQMAGHSDIKMTERYVAKGGYKLPAKAIAYLQRNGK